MKTRTLGKEAELVSENVHWWEVTKLLFTDDAVLMVDSLKRNTMKDSNRNGQVYKRKKQGQLYHRTCKRDFLCRWPSLNSYLK